MSLDHARAAPPRHLPRHTVETARDLDDLLRPLMPTAQPSSLMALVAAGSPIEFQPRDPILREDTKPATALLQIGYAGTWRSDSEGRSQLVALNGAGELVGLLSLGPHRRALAVTGLTAGRATIWRADVVLALASRDAGFASDLLQHSLQAAERLLTRLEHVGFDPVSRRLARLLWQRREVLFDARRPLLTRPQLADLAGATREMTDRVIRELEGDRIVRRIPPAGLVLVDAEALRRRASPETDDRECS